MARTDIKRSQIWETYVEQPIRSRDFDLDDIAYLFGRGDIEKGREIAAYGELKRLLDSGEQLVITIEHWGNNEFYIDSMKAIHAGWRPSDWCW